MGSHICSSLVHWSNLSGSMRVLIILALVALASAWKIRTKGTFERSEFEAYKAKYNKSFPAEEENMRHENYLRAIAEINKHNAEYDQGMHTWFMGENNFLDWTEAEREARNGYRKGMIPNNGKMFVPTGTAPDAVDWREKGAVQHVKDQGACGSCWAFGTVGALEGQQFLVNGNLPDCSEQQLVDCDKQSSGCNGGLELWAYEYIIKQGSHGLDTQSSYPYTARDGHCDKSKTGDDKDVCVTISGQTAIPQSEDALQKAIASVGPVNVGVYASTWSHYSGGIFDESCNGGINHAVLGVGYDTNEGYWIIKNSWGTSWGEEGYIRLVMGKDMCSCADDCLYPNL